MRAVALNDSRAGRVRTTPERGVFLPKRPAHVFMATLLVAAFASVGSAAAAVTVSQFALAPSTTQAGGHPKLSVSIRLSEPTGLKDIALPA
jgi:predicted RecA/RadA family phage recombinase